MNYFVTHQDPRRIAWDHCTIHRNKMIVEYSQVLSTAHRLIAGETITLVKRKPSGLQTYAWFSMPDDSFSQTEGGLMLAERGLFYAVTHQYHPVTQWVLKSASNYYHMRETLGHLLELYELYTGKRHGSHNTVKALTVAPRGLKDKGLTPFALAMPEQFQCGDPIQSYRNYLRSKFNEWLNRDIPIKAQWQPCKPYWVC